MQALPMVSYYVYVYLLMSSVPPQPLQFLPFRDTVQLPPLHLSLNLPVLATNLSVCLTTFGSPSSLSSLTIGFG